MFLWVFSEVITTNEHFVCFCLRWDHIFLIECWVSVSGELIVEYHFQDPTFFVPEPPTWCEVSHNMQTRALSKKTCTFHVLARWQTPTQTPEFDDLRTRLNNKSLATKLWCLPQKKQNFNSIRDSAEQTSLCHCSLRSALSKNTSAVTDKNKMKKKQKKTWRVTALTKHGCV